MPAAGINSPAKGATADQVQARIAKDLAQNRPIVVHVVVALCDNANQGIVRVPEYLGNGRDPRSNLYWGALYGVRTHLSRRSGWTVLSGNQPADDRILERVVLFSRVSRAGANVPVYLVADAWDGAQIKGALQRFLDMAAGGASETVRLRHDSQYVEIMAGGLAHLVAYAGHNGLMEFSLPPPQRRTRTDRPNSSIVLACASKPYFLDHLRVAESHALLLTTGLMAPEAYTLDAAIRSWIRDGSTATVREAAAQAYDRYQKCGLRAARRLFWGGP